jgi:hypothetical protein
MEQLRPVRGEAAATQQFMFAACWLLLGLAWNSYDQYDVRQLPPSSSSFCLQLVGCYLASSGNRGGRCRTASRIALSHSIRSAHNLPA